MDRLDLSSELSYARRVAAVADPPPAGVDGAELADVADVLAAEGARRCSVVAALEAIGDSWSLLVLRELFYDRRRFNDIQADLGISRSVLADRLGRLVELGVVRTEEYRQPGDRTRSQYRLTRKGVALLPTIVALKEWGDRYANDDPAVELVERATGDPVRLEFRTAAGAAVAPSEMQPVVRRPR